VAIKYAILGLLSWRPLSGYDIKKLFAESTALYWSGNSNQVYPTLVGLRKDNLVTADVEVQEGAPAKKVYTITASGLAELRAWVLSPPVLPQVRNLFLTQLAWAHSLSDRELDTMLEAYQEELRLKVIVETEKVRRGPASPGRTARERYLWAELLRHDIATYEAELQWVAGVRQGVGRLAASESGAPELGAQTAGGREEENRD
jgi:PadR family transcriptional regulator, regulatory protein AphA